MSALDPGPRLSICLPTGTDGRGMAMLTRTLGALVAQNVPLDRFEVCLGLDARAREDVAAVEMLAGTLAGALTIRVGHHIRPASARDIPHRNHARNAAWKVATSPLCFVLDADFVLPPHAVLDIVSTVRSLIHAGTPAVLSPILSQFGGVSTEEWFRATQPERWISSPETFARQMRAWTDIDRGTFSGFGELANGRHFMDASAPTPHPLSVGARMVEGMPILPRRFLDAVGGFDERYVGWGGDKISLVDVLRGLCREGVFDIRVLTSVIAMHQPHATDPTHTGPLAHENERRRQMARMEIEGRSLTWRRRVPALAAAMLAGFRECAPGAALPDVVGPEMVDVMAAVVRATKYRLRRVPGASVSPKGPYARNGGPLVRALAADGIDVDGAPGNVARVFVAVDPVDLDAPDHAAVLGRVDALRAEWSAETQGQAYAVVAQRIATSGPVPLRVSDIQQRLFKIATDARTLRVGSTTYALVTGRI